MKVINEEYKFSIDVPVDYKEISKEDYEEYNIDESTLNVFVKMDGMIPKTISINRDSNFSNLEEYHNLINLNILNMKNLGMNIEDESFIESLNGRRIDRIISSFRGLIFCTYFTSIRDMMIAASIELAEDDEEALRHIFSSIEEIWWIKL